MRETEVTVNGGVLDEGLANVVPLMVVMMMMMIRAGHSVGGRMLERDVLARGGFCGVLGACMLSA